MAEVTHNVSSDYLLEALNEQRTEGVLTDVVLEVDGEEFDAHKNILAAASDYFKIMFTGNFKEQTASIIDLDDTPISAETLEVILNVLYCGELNLSTTNILELIASLDFLQMKEHMPQCEQFLATYVSMESCVDYYEIATKYQLEEAAAAVRMFISKSFTTLYKTEEFTNFSFDSVSEILGQNDLQLNGEEIEVFRAACVWLESNEASNEEIVALLTNPNNMMVSSRRSVSWGIAQNTASEKIGEKCFLSTHFAHIFSLAVFRAAPQLSNFLPEKILNKMLRPYARQPGKVLNGLDWTNKCPAESILSLFGNKKRL